MKTEAVEQKVGKHKIAMAKLNQKVNNQAATINDYISRDGQNKRTRFYLDSHKSGINLRTLSNEALVRIIREEKIAATKTISALEADI
jgi:hypothetical protein